ncbi:glycosyl hydrolase family 18 protein [soil metagenome]
MVTISALAKIAAAAAAILMVAKAEEPRKLVVAYVPNWLEDNAGFADSIEYDKLTHINIAFENPDENGDLTFNPADEKLVKKAHENGVKILISIGGGSAADDPVLKPRYFDLIGDAKRVGFTQKLADYVEKHDFDGLDVDLEGPSINDDYGKFIDDLSTALKAKGKLLTAALSQGYGGDKVPSGTFARFDFVNVMAYDGTGSWDKDNPGQHSSLDYAKSNVKFWTDRGLPKSKVVLGVPFYGYGFGDAYRNYGYDYKEILGLFPDAATKDQVGSTIWYNGIPTMKAKAQWVRDEDLAGVMIWSLDADVKGDNSLLTALDKTLRP